MKQNTILIMLVYCLLSFTTSKSAIYNCCEETRGNIDGDSYNIIDISDLVFLVDFMFTNGPDPLCLGEANIDGDDNNIIDISDLVFLVDFMFTNGPAPSECPNTIKIINLQQNDNTVYGTANVSDTASTKVVLWAKTNQWYVQPSIAEPFTYIQSIGVWTSFTNPWDRIVALLVDSSYIPGATRSYHPSLDSGVINWDEYPNKSLRYINWSNYLWRVKTGNLVGPGPNYFSDDTANVWVDQQNRMHLKIDYRDNKWQCAEVVLDHSLGYGIYSFKLDSRVDSLDYNSILGCFIYETLDQEFDIEFSQRLANPFNAQYVAQPWYIEGNIEFYNMPSNSQSSHSFEWQADSIVFRSWSGHADNPTPSTLIHSWTYLGDNIPIPGGERMIFNLYLYGGEAPILGLEDEVIIKSFEFQN